MRCWNESVVPAHSLQLDQWSAIEALSRQRAGGGHVLADRGSPALSASHRRRNVPHYLGVSPLRATLPGQGE